MGRAAVAGAAPGGRANGDQAGALPALDLPLMTVTRIG